jgi:type IV secretory pathway VirB2 component (pilin)
MKMNKFSLSNVKKSSAIFIFSILLISTHAFAQNDPPLAEGELPEDLEPFRDTIFNDICQIRQMFCGNAALVIVATAVFVVGLMFFTGRTSWTAVLVIVTGAVIFTSAEVITNQLLQPPPGSLFHGFAHVGLLILRLSQRKIIKLFS